MAIINTDRIISRHLQKIFGVVIKQNNVSQMSSNLDKDIMINAPLGKIFNFVIKPSNMTQIWPDLVDVKNEQPLVNGGYSSEWFYKMDSILFQGTSKCVNITPEQWISIETKGSIESKTDWTFRCKDGQTRVTITVDYQVPVSVLYKLSDVTIVNMNKHEGELALANLKIRMEDAHVVSHM